MTNTYREMLVEVSEIFKYLPEDLLNKLPKQLLSFIDSNKSSYYKYTYDTKIPFNKHTFKRETLVFLGYLSLNYWTEDKKSKDKLECLFKLNNDLYIPQPKYKKDLFDNKKHTETHIEQSSKSLPVVIKKETFIQKIINLIKNCF